MKHFRTCTLRAGVGHCSGAFLKGQAMHGSGPEVRCELVSGPAWTVAWAAVRPSYCFVAGCRAVAPGPVPMTGMKLKRTIASLQLHAKLTKLGLTASSGTYGATAPTHTSPRAGWERKADARAAVLSGPAERTCVKSLRLALDSR